MPKIGEMEANDVRSAVLRHVASLKRARLTQGAFSRHFSSKKELLREAIDEGFTQGPFMPADQADQPLGNLIRRYLTKVHRQRGHVMSRTNFGDGNCAPPFRDEAGFHFTSAEELCSDRFQAFQQEARSVPPLERVGCPVAVRVSGHLSHDSCQPQSACGPSTLFSSNLPVLASTPTSCVTLLGGEVDNVCLRCWFFRDAWMIGRTTFQ